MHRQDTDPATTSTPATTWLDVRSVGLDRATRRIGAILADRADGHLLFVPLDRAGAADVAGARRIRSLEPTISLLLGVIASLGVSLRHVIVAPEPEPSTDSAPDTGGDAAGGPVGHLRVRGAALVLSDSSTVSCAPATALALSVHAGVPVRLGEEVARERFLPPERAHGRYVAAMADPAEGSVAELRRLLTRARAADFDLPA